MSQRYHDHRPSTPQEPRRNTTNNRKTKSREQSPQRSRSVANSRISNHALILTTTPRTLNDTRYIPDRYFIPLSEPRPNIASKFAGRPRWPPPPFVEDEKISLAREFRPPYVASSDSDYVPNRGAVDQVPIILPAHVPLDNGQDQTKTAARPNRAHPPYADSWTSSAAPHASTTAQGRNRASHPEFDSPLSNPSEFGTRHSTPYVFTPRATEASAYKASSGDSGYFSSSSTEPAKASASIDSRKTALGSSECICSDTLRGEGKSRDATNPRTRDGLPSEIATADFADRPSATSRRASQRYSVNLADPRQVDSRAGPRQQTGTEPPRLSELKAEASQEPKRIPDTYPNPSRSRLDDAFRKSSAASATIPNVLAGARRSDARGERVASSRPDSPVSQTNSPRSAHQTREDTPPSGRSSGAVSRQESRSSSRPSSPKHTEHRESFHRSSTFPTFPAFPSVPEDDAIDDARSVVSNSNSDGGSQSVRLSMASGRVSTATGLPYPVDDTFGMPSEEKHLHLIDSPMTPSSPIHSKSNSRDLASSTDMRMRPRLSSRHTFDGELKRLSTTSTGSRPSDNEQSPISAKSSASRSSKIIPECQRQQPSRRHDDWLTLSGSTKFNICPSCFEAVFAPSPFYKYFKRAEPKGDRERTACDFGSSPWIRQAWYLTQQQRRYDLDLVYAVARVHANEPPCPGNHRETRDWYTLADKRGYPLEKFDVCASDTKKAEALFPSVRGAFVRRSGGPGLKRKCDLRDNSDRFREYIRLLVDVDEEAHVKRIPPNLDRFLSVARQKSQMKECTRDELLSDVGWHFIPQIPEFTACEECYTNIVWPAIAEGSSIAGRFNRTPQLIYDEGKDSRRRGCKHERVPPGNSCQMYSDRMRRIFKKAVQTGDLGYLARKARERKDVEMDLLSHYWKLEDKRHDLERGGGSGSRKLSGLEPEYKKLGEEWKRWE